MWNFCAQLPWQPTDQPRFASRKARRRFGSERSLRQQLPPVGAVVLALFSRRMITVPHGSRHQVVRRPATSAIPAVRNSTPRASSSAPRRGDVVAHHADMGDADPGDRRPSGSGGATSAAGYSMSSMTRSSCPNPTIAAVHDDRRRDELAHVALDLLALHAVRRRQHRETEDVGIPAGGGLDVGHADGGVGESGQHAVSVRVRRVTGGRAGSAPAGDLVLQALVPEAGVHVDPAVHLAQHDHAHEHQRRERRPRRAENDEAQSLGTAP